MMVTKNTENLYTIHALAYTVSQLAEMLAHLKDDNILHSPLASDFASSSQVGAWSIPCQSQDLLERVVEQHKVCIVSGGWLSQTVNAR